MTIARSTLHYESKRTERERTRAGRDSESIEDEKQLYHCVNKRRYLSRSGCVSRRPTRLRVAGVTGYAVSG
jgi:hypothetical protein